MTDPEQLREEARDRDGQGTAETVDPADWASDLRIGDVVRVEPAVGMEPFETVIRGFSDGMRYFGQPVVSMGALPDSGAEDGWAVLDEEDGIEVLDDGE